MRLGALLAAAAIGAATFALPAADAAPARRTAAAARDWTRTVVATPEGGFRMGNPAARVKLVEYGSLTCGHCAAFARDGEPLLLQRYVRAGKISYEFRNYILNGMDVTATLLARCAGPRGFFGMADTLFRTQAQWTGRITGLTPAQKDQVKALPEAQRLARLAELGGLIQVAAQHGVAPARAKQCLADPAGLDRLGKMVEAAEALGVTSTPTFLLNGANIGVQTWATLEPILREQAGG